MCIVYLSVFCVCVCVICVYGLVYVHRYIYGVGRVFIYV